MHNNQSRREHYGQRGQTHQETQANPLEPASADTHPPKAPGVATAPAAYAKAAAVPDLRDAEASESLSPVIGYRAWYVHDGDLLSFDHTFWHPDYAVEARVPVVNFLFRIFPGVYSLLFAGYALCLVLLGLTAESADVPTLIMFIVGMAAGGVYLLYGSREHIAAILTGHRVRPGANTPGLYAMRDRSDVTGMGSANGHLSVRGRVYLWGDTIEHDRGVKGQYGYPLCIEDVSCVRCGGWMSLGGYDDRKGPPLHVSCRRPRSLTDRLRRALLFLRYPRPHTWKPAGLAELRLAAPRWFDSPSQGQE